MVELGLLDDFLKPLLPEFQLFAEPFVCVLLKKGLHPILESPQQALSIWGVLHSRVDVMELQLVPPILLIRDGNTRGSFLTIPVVPEESLDLSGAVVAFL
jgi:hypothetical protein